ncbi:hypothetical protein AYO44_06740 [Planctomycetaceae bacterium SCGC AG-212-F19]|nr:hypothetical protein AYO44_06740 [Planctomycetaceae bacterium SCGC AG-212-F19]
MRQSLFVILFIAFLLAAQNKDDAIAKDKAGLKGKWKLVLLTNPTGEKLEAGDNAEVFIIITDTTLTTITGAKLDYTINPTKNPKELDVSPIDGPNKGKVSKVIYKIEGDTLTICGGDAGSERPKAFEHSKELVHYVQTYKRPKQ